MSSKVFDPQVGDKVNYTIWTDVEPGTVVKRTSKTVHVQLDHAVCSDWERQDWSIQRDKAGSIVTFSLRVSGQWKRTGVSVNERGAYLSPGWRKYYDLGF
ncbi:hypothetical protein KC887_04335 [Candidatus Kaiserbacteria bacterium]|nr:hypothetical protein [Candidatus Kaiserbacteria bacterium]